MPVIKAEEFAQKKLTNQEEFNLRKLASGLKNIYGDDTSLLKENKDLDKCIKALDVLLGTNSKTAEIQKALDDLTGLTDFLKDGNEYNVNYDIILHDGDRNDNELNRSILENGLTTLQTLTGIEIDKAAIDDARNDKIINADRAGINPESKITRDVVVSEVTSLEGIKAAGKIGKNFFEPGCREAKNVENMLSQLNDAYGYLEYNIQLAQEGNRASGLEYDESVKLKDKIDEFRNAVETIRKAGADDSNVTSEEAEKALNTVKGMPAFLMGSLEKTNYVRLTECGVDSNAFENGMNALEKALKTGIDMDKIANAEAKPNSQFKANQSIEGEQDYIKTHKDQLISDSDLFKQTITKIMATRMNVNSVLGKGKSLDVWTSSASVEKTEQKLLGNQHFRDFLSTMAQDPKKVKLALSAARSGHGGGLDKMFTAYLKTRPAGQLQNSPDLKRYMPTVKSRIEFLQNKAAESYNKNRKAPVPEIAEIVALRYLSTSKTTQKPILDAKIPANNELTERVAKYVKSAKFSARCESPAILNYVRKGHGEVMQKNMLDMVKLEKEAQKGAEEANKQKQKQVMGGPKF